MTKRVCEPATTTPAAALELARKAYTNQKARNDGVVLFGGSKDDLALLYQASRHFGLPILGVQLRGQTGLVTEDIKTRKAAAWKAFIDEQNRGPEADVGPVAAEASDPLRTLQGLIGLDSVKAQVNDIVHLMKNRKDRERVGLPVIGMSQHMVFTGNAGTGKTTVARLVSEIYRDLGILRKGHLIETDGRGLIAEYVGQTDKKTRMLVTDALDGVLFIDEAYALVPKDTPNDFGSEAVATLIKMMEDHRDRLVVIVAGYQSEMARMLDSNPGLKSRFKTRIDFPDFTAQELTRIFDHLCRDAAYYLTPSAEQVARALFAAMHRNAEPRFGNGRTVRNAFDRAVTNHARRLACSANPSRRDLQVLDASDIPSPDQLDW